MGADEFNRKNAEQAKKWRDNNRDKCDAKNELRKSNPGERLKYYKSTARDKGIKWEIHDDKAIEMFKQKCNYCGEFDKYELNGIDRIDNELDYTNDNVVSCCEICNIMKGTYNIKHIMNKTKHILTKWFLIDKIYNYLEIFKNNYASSYKLYKKRANKMNISFDISNEQFKNIIIFDCYICGKIISEYNINGIDRVDNNIGYTISNCLPCCYECNIMKNKYNITDVMRKLYKFYCKNHNIMILNDKVIHQLVNTNVKFMITNIMNTIKLTM